jgi:hypothetical protein
MRRTVIVASAVVCIIISILFSCNNSDKPSIDSKTVEEGSQLAAVYCKTCHKLPSPDLLDKKSWALYVLPKMGRLLGFRSFDNGRYFQEGSPVGELNLNNWNKIVVYFVSQAPKKMERKTPAQKILTDLKLFKPETSTFSLKNPATTFISIDSAQHLIRFADGLAGRLYTLRSNSSPVDSFKVGVGLSALKVETERMYALTMGVMHPSDAKAGQLNWLNPRSKKSTLILDSLRRPVHFSFADLNNDSREDIVISEFGNTVGKLGWFENKGKDIYEQHTLRALPGSIRTQIADLNKDGKPDIVSLMAQGDEGIFIYYNMGGGKFEEHRVLELSPAYGSNYFELADFNHDGFLDIIATNGDNGDFPPILKPYHGIRIYLNDGKNNFTEKIFLPVNGACKAITRDFDGDGDIDIASIAYFPDFENTPEESFIYWENTGNLSFHPSSFAEVAIGRWLTMDAGDVDGDGDIDIVLGNAKFPLGYVPARIMQKWNAFSPSFVILRNTLH